MFVNGNDTEQHAEYWIGKDIIDSINLSDKGSTLEEAVRLASIKKAISNFVNIVTGKDYPVRYSTGRDSYTDGKTVVISADTDTKNFDTIVGTALHEASHILLSNFNFIKKLYGQFGPSIAYPSEIMRKSRKLHLPDTRVATHIADLINIIEDRRIDYFIYRTAPGYRPYYQSLYDTYFNSEFIDTALKYGLEWNTPTVSNYIDQICNSVNKNFNPDALPGLSKMMKILDWDTIYRLDNDAEAFDYACGLRSASYDMNKMPKIFQLAVTVFGMILDECLSVGAINQPSQPKQNGQMDAPTQNGKSQGLSSNSNKEDNLDIPRGQNSNNDSSDDTDNDSENTDKSESESDKESSNNNDKSTESKQSNEASDEIKKFDKKKFDQAAEQQKKFIRGDVTKKTVSGKLAQDIDALIAAGTEIKEVGQDYAGSTFKVPLIIYNKLDKAILKNPLYPFGNGTTYGTLSRSVTNGIAMGQMLATKLTVRNTDRETKYTRQVHGRLDKRMLASLGCNLENVFYNSRLDYFKPANIHLSLDASGSMYGGKWEKTISLAVAMAYVADKIKNINVVISLRASSGSGPCVIAIIYDSTKDKFAKVRELFPYLNVGPSTPEGLAFEGTLDIITRGKNSDRNYFINISDGEPCYHSHNSAGQSFTYAGESAAKHTRTQVQNIRMAGVKVLSYFVTESSHYVPSNAKRLFEIMYGKDASFVDITNISGIAMTMNKFLSESDSK